MPVSEPYLTEDSQTILTEDGLDTLVTEGGAAGGRTLRDRQMAAIIQRRKKKAG